MTETEIRLRDRLAGRDEWVNVRKDDGCWCPHEAKGWRRLEEEVVGALDWQRKLAGAEGAEVSKGDRGREGGRVSQGGRTRALISP